MPRRYKTGLGIHGHQVLALIQFYEAITRLTQSMKQSMASVSHNHNRTGAFNAPEIPNFSIEVSDALASSADKSTQSLTLQNRSLYYLLQEA